MLAALVLLCVVGAFFGLVFLPEESVGSLRARAFEAKRWVLVRLDSLGQAPDIDSDCDCDLEAGFGEAREALVDNGKRAATVQQSKPARPVRRSVHRGQGSGGISTSARVSSSPPPEYADLLFGDRTPEGLPRPTTLSAAMSSGGGRPPDGKAPLPHKSHRRGMSFDVNAAASRADHQHNHHHPHHHRNETNSARGSFALPRPAFSPDVAAGGSGTLHAEVVTAFGTPPAPEVQQQGGHATEKQIPPYVALQKQGSLSKATHRRSSSRGAADAVGGGGGGAGAGGAGTVAGGGGAAWTGSAGLSGGGTPDTSPFFGVRSPQKVLPPVPAFAGAGGGDLATLPPQWREGPDNRGSGGPGHFRQQPGRSPRQHGGSGAISPVPFAPDNRQSAAPTTPKHGQQQQQQQEAPSGRGSSFLAGPSPDGDNSFSHIDYVASYVAESLAGGGSGGKAAHGGPFWNKGVSDAYDKQRDERAPISVLPASPAWSVDDDVNRGTGVRRRLSPRATGGGGGGSRSPCRSPRSPRGGAGWAPMVSPRRRGSEPARAGQGQGAAGGGGGGGELRPLALAFSEEASTPPPPPPPPPPRPHREKKNLRIDVGVAERVGTGFAAAAGPPPLPLPGTPPPASPMNTFSRAKTPLAGAGRRASGMAGAGGASVAAEAAAAEAAAAAEIAAAETTARQVGLRCSSPIYDRGRNMLGTAGEGAREDRKAAATPTRERQGGSAEHQAAEGAGDTTAKDAGSGAEAVGGTEGAPAPPPPAASMVAAANGTVDEAAPGGAAEEAQAPGQERQKASGENGRQGRDLSSSEAFAASLDLPFDQLELSELIGGGGFGQVYQGVWRGTPVAIKVLVPVAQRDLDEELAADFRAEVLMLAALRHPNVCLFMGACMVPPNRAIVTELLTRGSLWEALRADKVPEELASASSSSASQQGGGGDGNSSQFVTPQDCWPWSVVVKVAEGVACGMWYLHQHEPFPILHRDLKSANLLLDESFNVKICDFGLARLKAFTNSATMTGNCGTVQWMAPEVLASEKYAEPADVYSFAIVCWELLSRACPYDGMSQIQVAVAVLNDSLRPKIPKWCPSEFASLIKTGWEQDPSKRPSFGDVLEIVRRNHASPRS